MTETTQKFEPIISSRRLKKSKMKNEGSLMKTII